MYKDIVFSLLFSFMYVITVNKSLNVYLSDLTYSDRFQQSTLIIFMIALLSLTLAYTIFDSNENYKNNIIKMGLIFGAIWIMFHSLFINWDIISEQIKLLVVGVLFALIIWFSYNTNNTNNKKINKTEKMDGVINNKKQKKQNKNKKKNTKKLEPEYENAAAFEFDFT